MRARLVIALVALVLPTSACRRESERGSGVRAQARAESDPTQGVEQAPSQGRQSSACGRIAFVSTQGEGIAQTMVIPAAGGEAVHAIAPQSDGAQPSVRSRFPAAVSPDGQRLLILRSEPLPNGTTQDAFELLELDADSKPSARAIELGALASEGRVGMLRNPTWSPDGTFLVFESNAKSFRDLYRLDLESRAISRLTDDEQGNFEPAISPDSRRVAFVSSREGNAEVFVMAADGSNQVRLTQSPGDDTAPQWSPGGDSIAFLSARDRSRGIDVYAMADDGSEQRPVGEAGAAPIIARDLAFSPDGSRLAWTRLEPSGGAKVVVVDVQSGVEEVETTGAVDQQPVWSPDGRYLVLSRNGEEGRSDLIRISADGSGAAVLTDGAGTYWLPRWLADPKCAGA